MGLETIVTQPDKIKDRRNFGGFQIVSELVAQVSTLVGKKESKEAILLKSIENEIISELDYLGLTQEIKEIFVAATIFKERYPHHTANDVAGAQQKAVQFLTKFVLESYNYQKKEATGENDVQFFIQKRIRSKDARDIFFGKAKVTTDLKNTLFTEKVFTDISDILSKSFFDYLIPLLKLIAQFLPQETQQKLENFSNKYIKSSSSFLQFSLWEDLIFILEDIKKITQNEENEECVKKVNKVFYVFSKLLGYLVHLHKESYIKNGNIAQLSKNQTVATLSLFGYIQDTLKSGKGNDFGEFVDSIFIPLFFSDSHLKKDIAFFLKSSFFKKVLDAGVKPENKKILTSTILYGKNFFFGKKTDEIDEVFTFLLQNTLDIESLDQCKIFFRENLHRGCNNIFETITFICANKSNLETYMQNLDLKKSSLQRISTLTENAQCKKLSQTEIEQLSLLQSKTDYKKGVTKIFTKEFLDEGSVEEILDSQSKFLIGRDLKDGPNMIYRTQKVLQSLGKKSRVKMLWEIFSFKHSDDDIIYLLELLENISKNGNAHRFGHLIGKIHQLILVCKKNGINKNSILDKESIEIIFVYIGESDASKNVSDIMNKHQESDIGKEIKQVFGKENGEKILTHLEKTDTQEDVLNLIIRIGQILNGMGSNFTLWLIHQEQIEENTLENIASFFHFVFSIREKKIHSFHSPEKIFRFLANQDSQECKSRITKLYEMFISSGKISEVNFEGFKDTLLRFMKNGDIDILENFLKSLYHQQEVILEPESSPNLRGYTTKLQGISFQELVKKLAHYGFHEDEGTRGANIPKGRGGHRYFYNEDGIKITVSHHPGDMGIQNIRNIIQVLKEIIPDFSQAQWNSI